MSLNNKLVVAGRMVGKNKEPYNMMNDIPAKLEYAGRQRPSFMHSRHCLDSVHTSPSRELLRHPVHRALTLSGSMPFLSVLAGTRVAPESTQRPHCASTMIEHHIQQEIAIPLSAVHLLVYTPTGTEAEDEPSRK